METPYSAYFSSAWIENDRLHIPTQDGDVIFDLKSGKARAGHLEVDLEQIKKFTIEHRSQEGDNKTHHYYTVLLQDEHDRTLCLEGRVKDYFEFHPEVHREMVETRCAIHALPGLLGLPAVMAHPQFAPSNPRSAYKTRSQASSDPSKDSWVGGIMLGLAALGFLWWRGQSRWKALSISEAASRKSE